MNKLHGRHEPISDLDEIRLLNDAGMLEELSVLIGAEEKELSKLLAKDGMRDDNLGIPNASATSEVEENEDGEDSKIEDDGGTITKCPRCGYEIIS